MANSSGTADERKARKVLIVHHGVLKFTIDPTPPTEEQARRADEWWQRWREYVDAEAEE